MFLHLSVCLQGIGTCIQGGLPTKGSTCRVVGQTSPPPNQKVGGTHPTGMLSSYRPQLSCEGYVFTGVCLSTGGVPDLGACAWSGGCLVPGGLL